MVSRSNRFVVTYNGEIYNFGQLRAELEHQNGGPRSACDTEVLLDGIEAWGLRGFLERADGMFAFGLYDRRERQFYLVRDRFGEKPLAYTVVDGVLYFASELTALTTLLPVQPAVEPRSLALLWRFGYLPGQDTIFSGVRRVRPASILQIDLGGSNSMAVHQYWEPPHYTSLGTVPSDDHLLHVLSASVRARMVSDRPLGAFLSGGIDSSLVCALAARNSPGRLQTFTMGWEDQEYDESTHAAAVASVLASEHHDIRLGRTDIVAAVQSLGSVMDEPFADSSLLAVLAVAAEARKRVVVALSGDGGDELFGGYNRHRWLLRIARGQRRVSQPIRLIVASGMRGSAPVLERLIRPIPPTRRPRLVGDKIRKLSAVVGASSVPAAYQSLISQEISFGDELGIPPLVQQSMSSHDQREVFWALRVADIAGYLPDDILTKVDRGTMSVSLESRTPFLSTEVAELALAMGPSELIGRDGGKQPLRRLLRRLLPGISFSRPKTGFGVPYMAMMRVELRDLLGDAVATHIARQPPVAPDWRLMFESFQRGDDVPGTLLWSLLMFETWAAARCPTVSWS